MDTPQSAPIIEECERITGSESGSVVFNTEAAILQQLGCDCVVLGPGSIEQAHKPDEFIELRQVKLAISVYTKLIANRCGADGAF